METVSTRKLVENSSLSSVPVHRRVMVRPAKGLMSKERRT
jgi:hypothetical protein